MRNNGSKCSLLQMRKLRPPPQSESELSKVKVPVEVEARTEPGSFRPGMSHTPGLGLGQLSCPSHGPQVRSPVCCLGVSFTPEITATGSQKPPESTSYARHPDKGPEGARKKPDATRGTHPGRVGAPRRPRSVGPAPLKHGQQPHEPARRHKGAPGPAHTHPAAPPPPPRDAESRGLRHPSTPPPPAPPRTPRPRPTSRTALLGPAPGPGRPRAVTPPVGAARARLGAQWEASSRLCTAKWSWERPFISRALSGDAQKRLRPRRPRAATLGLSGPLRCGRGKFPPLFEPRSAHRKSDVLPLRSSPRRTKSRDQVDEAILGTRNFSGTCF